jgi:hypothetical protein
MNYVLPGIFIVMGVLYIVFAFVTPPHWAANFFRLPFIFALLPDRLVRPVGSSLTGLLLIGTGIWFATLMIR